MSDPLPDLTQAEAVAELHRITAGIDACETEAENGWWETTTGAEFGARKVAELEDLVRKLTTPVGSRTSPASA